MYLQNELFLGLNHFINYIKIIFVKKNYIFRLIKIIFIYLLIKSGVKAYFHIIFRNLSFMHLVI